MIKKKIGKEKRHGIMGIHETPASDPPLQSFTLEISWRKRRKEKKIREETRISPGYILGGFSILPYPLRRLPVQREEGEKRERKKRRKDGRETSAKKRRSRPGCSIKG